MDWFMSSKCSPRQSLISGFPSGERIHSQKAKVITTSARTAIMTTFAGYLLLNFLSPSGSYANPFYEAGCRNAVNDYYPGRYSQETVAAYCQCRSKNRGKAQNQCTLDPPKNHKVQKFSNSEEYTIGVMTATICAKRLGRLSNERANKALLKALSEEGIHLSLGSRVDLWEEAYKDVGEGIEWCIKNQ
jgi:hypothetical protein